MRRADDEDMNPYQAPSALSSTDYTQPVSERAKLLKRFRRQCDALSFLWLLVGAMGSWMMYLVFFLDKKNEPARVGGIAAAFAVTWIGLGLLAMFRNVWAVRLGLWLSYAMPIAMFFTFVIEFGGRGLCATSMPMIGLIAGIPQAHRLIRWSRQLQAVGIPLDTRPDEMVDET